MGKSREIMDELERANEEEEAIEFDRETRQFLVEDDSRDMMVPQVEPRPTAKPVAQQTQKFYD